MEYSIQEIIDLVGYAMAIAIPISFVISLAERMTRWFLDLVTGRTVIR